MSHFIDLVQCIILPKNECSLQSYDHIMVLLIFLLSCAIVAFIELFFPRRCECKMCKALLDVEHCTWCRLTRCDDRHWQVQRQKADVAFECVICMENVHNGQEVCVLPCKHKLHLTCADDWSNYQTTCPICRHKFII